MFESGDRSQLTVADVPSLVGGLAALDLGDLTDARRVELIGVLESLKGAAAGVQARLAVDFAESQDASAHQPDPRSVAAQVALARRESPHRGSRHLGFARAMLREMPHTMGHLAAGRVSEWRATILCRETACLSIADRAAVDAALAADLPTLGDRQVQSRARALASRLDASAMAKRATRAQADRRVSLRPAPDTMTYLTALLPVAQGVAVFAALERAATTERATTACGTDDRGRGQLMADTLVERVTGQAAADAVPVEVVVVMSADTLAGRDDAPAEVPAYGPVPADTARAMLAASSETEASIWFLRALTCPTGARLVGLDSRRRLFPEGLKRFLGLRDKTCRTPWCDAPIRHADHVRAVRRGGPTTAANGQGLCETCNHVKEADGWSAWVIDDGTGQGARHRVRLRTPTGATYDSTAPPLLEGMPPPESSRLEGHLELLLGAA